MPLKFMAGLLIKQLASLTKSGAWGVAIMGKVIFPSHSTPGLPWGTLPYQILPGRMLICGNPFFLPITWLPIPPRCPFLSIAHL